ncbi:serine/threonine-protein kinase haspin, partial [Tremellales sp. Uapishka_1]
MTSLGPRTKKVTTYGRKKTNIITVLTDLSPSRPTVSPPTTADSLEPPSPYPASKTRPPLQTKSTQEIVSAKKNIVQPVCIYDFSKTKTTITTPEKEVVIRTRRVSKPKVKVPKSVQTPAKKAVFDGVELPVSKRSALRYGMGSVMTSPSKGSEERNLIQKLSNIRLRSPVDELLEVTTSSDPQPFASFLTSPALLSLLPGSDSKTVRKVGEASYSEVFSIANAETEMVIKIIPLLADPIEAGEGEEDIPFCSEVKDVLREVEITKRMSNVPGGGFVKCLGAFVVEGIYPDELLEQWDLWTESHKTESQRPDTFTEKQQYTILVLSHGGSDLESFKFDSAIGWLQAAGVFWNIVDSLARAEEWSCFEHRDLHEGQILISPLLVSTNTPTAVTRGYLNRIQTSIIDFGLSRLDMSSSKTVCTPLPQEVYEGVGEQWNVYRAMRDVVGEDWEGYHSRTNVLWLNYVLRYLLHSVKSLRKPTTAATRTSKRTAMVSKPKDSRRAQVEKAYHDLVEVEKMLKKGLKLGKGNSGGTLQAMGSARDLFAWGQEEGWVV